eukprot:UN11595
MESCEQPYMAKLATIAGAKGGIVLEVGFGLGLSGRALQNERINEHIIIEANKSVYDNLVKFAAKEAEAGRPRVTPLYGLWQEIVPTLPNNLLDGVLYDTYPLNKEEQHTHQFDFIKTIQPKLKKDR